MVPVGFAAPMPTCGAAAAGRVILPWPRPCPLPHHSLLAVDSPRHVEAIESHCGYHIRFLYSKLGGVDIQVDVGGAIPLADVDMDLQALLIIDGSVSKGGSIPSPTDGDAMSGEDKQEQEERSRGGRLGASSRGASVPPLLCGPWTAASCSAVLG
ncbi:hypothetical protein Taro_029744 [Colocasia esculenta]|uniref:Uncharacterized protein n=1 Tax=Colocasia esculenta TaxID=4460 RepID=A0A843W168_COLES|nr:hypothetical protein [Colocasia esculenta]